MLYDSKLTSESQAKLLQAASPIELWKSIKNSTEIEGMKAAYLRDAVAWVTWLARLESRIKKSATSKITEWQAAEELTRLREKQDKFAGLAYENISASGANAGQSNVCTDGMALMLCLALPHYSATKASAAPISKPSPYLNDSGAQYRDGTIDTTRTYHFGRPKPEHR
jgi:Xaa-Pro aminopeptidase